MSEAARFARHEARLAWRDIVAMITAGRPGRRKIAFAMLAGLVALMHFVAWKVVGPYADVTFPPDRSTLLVVTGTGFLAWTVMISQAMESVTRAFYARADLDLLLSSPAPVRTIFVFRIAAIGLTTSLLALALIGPFVNTLAVVGGPHWLAAYGVLLAMAATATALAIGLTILLFHLLGARRTRFIAQVVAAVVGAAFVIGVQAISIFAYGSLSRFDAFLSDSVVRLAPLSGSLFWLPARAAMGDLGALVTVVGASLALFCLAVSAASRRYGQFATAAAGLGMREMREKTRTVFRGRSAASALRRKEWTLLARDPWLVSQTMMQVLYLIPPGLLLWRNYGEKAGGLAILAPVLVMAAGQLAGGLAWLAISGEDAPDLVSTAPLRRSAVMRAKIEAVFGAVAIVLSPIVLALATASLRVATITTIGVFVASASATAIQMIFRSPARRSHMRRRHTASRVATFAEAFSSIGWAGTAGLAAASNPLAGVAAVMTLMIVGAAGLMRPRQMAA